MVTSCMPSPLNRVEREPVQVPLPEHLYVTVQVLAVEKNVYFTWTPMVNPLSWPETVALLWTVVPRATDVFPFSALSRSSVLGDVDPLFTVRGSQVAVALL